MSSLSVLVSVYNGRRYVAKSIDSLLRQSFADFELIIADDRSTDGTRAILDEYERRDDRVRIIDGPRQGLGAVRNLLVKNASAPLLAWLDADDIAHPDRLAKQLRFMESNPEVVGAGTSVRIIDEDGDAIKNDIRPADHETIDRELIDYEHNAIFFPSSIVRRSSIDQIGGFRNEFPVGCDTDLWLRLAEVGRLANLPEVLVDYRWHAGSNSWKVPLWQRERAMNAINDARRRRGLEPMVAENSPEARKEVPRAAIHDSWAVAALAAGNVDTAKKHAWRALRHNCCLRRPWNTLAMAHFPFEKDRERGPFARPFVSVLRRVCLGVARIQHPSAFHPPA